MIKILDFHKFTLVFLFLFLSACNKNLSEEEKKELWSKAQTTGEIINRSGTPFNSAVNKDLALSDAQNRLITGGGLFGKKSSLTFGDKEGEKNTNVGTSMGMPINPYLWRAGLESTSFLPLSSADPFGGIIITDWYNDKNNLNERCKINIFIKGVELTTNNLKATIFCQEKVSDNWIDKKVDNDKNIAFENVILEKAKRLRISSQ